MKFLVLFFIHIKENLFPILHPFELALVISSKVKKWRDNYRNKDRKWQEDKNY